MKANLESDSSQVYKERTWCKMDSAFPVDTEEGKVRVDYFRRLKLLLKFLAGKRSFHNFVTGGASPDDMVFTLLYFTLLKTRVGMYVCMYVCICCDIM